MDTVLENDTVKGLLIFSCDANGFTPKSINGKLAEISVPFLGGIFPEIIAGKEKLEKGTVVAGFSLEPNVQIIPDLSDTSVDYDEVLDEKIPEIDNIKTMFVLVDGFSKRISTLVDSLFNIFGLEFNYIGGGTGSLSMEQKPCLFTSEGFIQDSAVLATLDIESSVAVTHGWERIAGPFKVTESDRNVVKTIDWKPAFQLYRDVVEKNSDKRFQDDNFFVISKCHPFGISKLGAERIVRDPFMRDEDDSLICVGEVPQDSFIDILKGDINSLVTAAGRALRLAKEGFTEETSNKTVLFIDCISRVLFLEKNFDDELMTVYDESTPMIGALTIGEIANSDKDYLEFYNKTSVVGILGD